MQQRQQFIIFAVMVVVLVLGSASVGHLQAQQPPTTSNAAVQTDARSVFRFFSPISFPAISTPSIVSVKLPDTIPFPSTYVREAETGIWVGRLHQTRMEQEQHIATCFFNQLNPIQDPNENPGGSDCRELIDSNDQTTFDVPAPVSQEWVTQFTLYMNNSPQITGFHLTFAEYSENSALISVSSQAQNAGTAPRQLVVRKPLVNGEVYFPFHNASIYQIKLEHSQPLRIKGVTVLGVSVPQVTTLSFLAQPGRKYDLYGDPERPPQIKMQEMPTANFTQTIMGTLTNRDGGSSNPSLISKNEMFQQADTDKDGIPDAQDNCSAVSNSDQTDVNGNGRGDVCDDFDADGVVNTADNCREVPNRNQLDDDGDGVGDECDPEESRLTEKHPWIPWVAFVGTGAVLLGMMGYLFMKKDTALTDDDTLNDTHES